MLRRRHIGTTRKVLAAAAAMAALLVASAASLASGTSSVVQFTRAWGWGVSNGSSQFETCTTTCQAGIQGEGAGQLSAPAGIAVNSSTGDVYVSHYNSRVDEFSSTGSFIRAWGWGVSNGASSFETCTSSCQAGLNGGGAGQLWDLAGLTVDPSSGDVFVADALNERIDVFSASGTFIQAWGWGVKDGANQFETCTTGAGCLQGRGGGGAGQMNSPEAIALDGSDVYVADTRNNRIDVFSTSGTFIRAWGWGVGDGASQLETCTSSCQQGLSGGGTGQMWGPDGVAAGNSGEIYVAEQGGLNRIDEFSATGGFIRTWGWGVKDGLNKPETCTSSCQGGIGAGGAGAFDAPVGLDTDAAGDVYVTDQSNQRIDEFTSTGGFMLAWGWGVIDSANHFENCTTACRTGNGGGCCGGAGQFNSPTAVAVPRDGSGHIYVADQNNNRVELFTLFLQPTVTGLSPKSGPASGGTKVTITGAHFAHVRRVMFGTESASFKVVSNTKITATSPDGAAGTTVTVKVTTPGGIAGAIQFHYVRHNGA